MEVGTGSGSKTRTRLSNLYPCSVKIEDRAEYPDTWAHRRAVVEEREPVVETLSECTVVQKREKGKAY